MNQIEFTDRYQAMGIPYPDPQTCCKGQCEGTGMVPIGKNEEAPVFRALWQKSHSEKCALSPFSKMVRFFRDWREVREFGIRTHWDVCFGKCDGWHFVKCPDCAGTGFMQDAHAAPVGKAAASPTEDLTELGGQK